MCGNQLTVDICRHLILSYCIWIERKSWDSSNYIHMLIINRHGNVSLIRWTVWPVFVVLLYYTKWQCTKCCYSCVSYTITDEKSLTILTCVVCSVDYLLVRLIYIIDNGALCVDSECSEYHGCFTHDLNSYKPMYATALVLSKSSEGISEKLVIHVKNGIVQSCCIDASIGYAMALVCTIVVIVVLKSVHM